MRTINYRDISWESFEDLCSSLWFDEGYTNIQPYGHYREGGRDAVFRDANRDDLVIFQYKRWTARKTPAQFQRAVGVEIDKIKQYHPKKYILNSVLEPSASNNDWIVEELQPSCGFEVEYWDRSWLDLRLNNSRQDLRREYFSIQLERHTWASLLPACQKQVKQAIKATGQTYISAIYVERQDVANSFANFVESDKTCFLIIGSSGTGKTNLLCHLASVYSRSLPVLLLSGRRRIHSESALVVQIADQLGYASSPGTRRQHGVDDVIRVLRENQSIGVILIDGVSENDDIVLMRRALLEFLTQYEDVEQIKVVVTCRDTLWHRLSTGFPARLVYQDTEAHADEERSPASAHLGRWTEDEFGEALVNYKRYFDVHCRLSEQALDRCKHPFLLRLFCEAYSGRSLGDVKRLPPNKVFQDYLDRKTEAIADYFGLSVEPTSVDAFLVNFRTAMWNEDDSRALSKGQTLGMLCGFGDPAQVYARLMDEGLLAETLGDPRAEPRTGFLFEGLGDYLLYRHFMQSWSHQHPSHSLIRDLCLRLQSDSLDDRVESERFLELIARNVEDVEVQEHLLEQSLAKDLYTFSRCADQKLLVPNLPDQPEQKAYEFSRCLIKWYHGIVQTWFPSLRDVFDPLTSREPSQSALGIVTYVSPCLRELSYSYKARNRNQPRIEVEVTEGYPTFRISFGSGESRIQLHDPEGGLSLTEWRGPDSVRRVLNPGLPSPFPGASLYAAERVAKYDVWNELINIIGQHYLREPIPLLNERTATLIDELAKDGVTVVDADSILQSRKSLLRLDPHSRRRVEIELKLDEAARNLAVMNYAYDSSWLPGPGIEENAAAIKAPWERYSDDGLRDYLRTLFTTFVTCYRGVIGANLSAVSQRMNLYRQWPVSVHIVVSTSRGKARVLAAAENEEDEANLWIHLLPTDAPIDVASGTIETTDGVSIKHYAEEILRATGRMATNSQLIDVILPMSALFGRNPLNNLTYTWIKAELAEVLGVYFRSFGLAS